MKNNLSFFVPNNKNESEYIGFNFEKNTSIFMFPCQYLRIENKSEKEQVKIYRQEAKKIITVLKRMQKEYLFGGFNSELQQYYSMLWLLQDFVENGYYVETEMVSGFKVNGKINWKQTIKANSIFFCNNNIIYNKLARNRKVIDKSQILSQIYKSCLQYSSERIGFIFGIGKTEKSVYKVESKDKEYLSFWLKNELKNTFKDYKKTLINHLLSIINNQNTQQKNIGFSIYDREFEYVFEKMINVVFGNQDVKQYFNKYQYYLPDDKNIKPASKLRPDTILKDEENKIYYIIDSKYYNFGYTNDYKDLPQSSSISKQLGYNRFLKEKLKNKNYVVKSIFVLPFASKDNEKIKYVGYAKSESCTNIEDKIGIYLIDLKALVDTYLNAINKYEKLTPQKLLKIINS